LIGPGVTSLDFSVFKNTRIKRISENFNVQFRAEIFNILNHPNFGVPSTTGDANTDIFDGTGASQSPANGGIAGALVRTTISPLSLFSKLRRPIRTARDFYSPGNPPSGSVPECITFTPDSKTVFVSNSGARPVSAIDAATLKLIAVIPVREVPERINTVF
jgi:YVTN family beta-propeller protein